MRTWGRRAGQHEGLQERLPQRRPPRGQDGLQLLLLRGWCTRAARTLKSMARWQCPEWRGSLGPGGQR